MIIYILIFLALQSGALFLAPASEHSVIAYSALSAISFVFAAYFLPAVVIRLLAICHFTVLYLLPYLIINKLPQDPLLVLSYAIGLGFAVEALHFIGTRQRALLARSQAAEAQARATQSLLSAILDTSPNQIVVKDRELRFTYVNPAFLAISGWRAEGVLGKRAADLMGDGRAAQYEELDHYVLREGRAHPARVELIPHVDGGEHWYRLSKMPIFDAHGAVESVLAVSVDVSELKATQDALQRTIGLLQNLAQVSAQLLATDDFDESLANTLPSIGEALSARELCLLVKVGADGSESTVPSAVDFDGERLVPNEDATLTVRYHWRDAASPAPHRGESLANLCQTLSRDTLKLQVGRVISLTMADRGAAESDGADSDSATTAPFVTDGVIAASQAFVAPISVDGALWGALALGFETSRYELAQIQSFLSTLATNLGVAIARHQAQHANARERNLLRTLIDNAPDFVYIKDADLRYRVANRAFVEVMGYQHEDEIIGKTDFDIHPQEIAIKILHLDRPILLGEIGTNTIQEEVILPLTLEHRWMLTTKAPFHNVQGEVVGLITIARDVTEMKEVENRMREAKDAAETATRAKSEFLANMSHEIRTPMNGVIGMTSLLQSTQLQPEQREFVETIRTSGDDLLMILNDILDYSKIESGKMTLGYAVFDPLAALEDVVDLYYGRHHRSAVSVGLVVGANVPAQVQGDVTRFRQILGNLLANALKFTAQGEVLVRMTAEPLDQGQVRLAISVRDTGIGIPAARLDRLFQSFSQVDGSITRRFGGTGLGLAISKRLVEIMGGTIQVESHEGQGSEFQFTIVVDDVAPPTMQTGVETGAGSDASYNNGASAGLPSAQRSKHYPRGDTYRGCHFLVAEVNPASRAALGAQLAEWGGAVSYVEDVADFGYSLAQMRLPAMLICDMPWYADALAAMQRAEIEAESIAILPVAASSTPERADPAQSWEQKKMLLRPIKPSALASAVANAMAAQLETSQMKMRRGWPAQAEAKSLLSSPASALPIQTPILADELPARVLLVEDNAVNQQVALRMLERLGYPATLAKNGLEAIQFLREETFDIVFMDVHMPEMDGHTATRVIRLEIDAAQQPYIIAMTADAMPGYREECLAAGMDDYIAKPVRLEDLTAAFRRIQERPWRV